MKFYRNITTNEKVYKEEAEEYALYELGLMDKGKLIIVPKGKDNTYTEKQKENIKETVDWFFSGNWIEEEITEVEEASIFELINEECELEDGRNKI